MTDREELDERFRSRLRALAAVDPAEGLDERARSRVIDGARLRLRRERGLRLATAISITACAAAAVLWLSVGPDSEHVVTIPARVPLRCEAWAPVADDALRAEGVWSLGARGAVLAREGSRVALGASTPCRTELRLDAGSIVVRADDLGEGELEVIAGSHRVRVTGTLFAVERSDRGLLVRVAEGHVEVHEGDSFVALDPGQELTFDDGGREVHRVLDVATLDGLRSAFEPSLAPVDGEPRVESEDLEDDAASEVTGAPLDPGVLALDAERRYRSGDLAAARAGFRQAAARSEAATLRWARLELDAGALDQAAAALALHQRRHRRGAMGAEAEYLRLELAEARHDEAAVRDTARRIIERYPGTPQARAAARRL